MPVVNVPEVVTILWIGWTLLGAIVGSFLNAFVYRWPRRISLLTRTRSFCPRCEEQIAWYDNVPVLSYLVLAGRCRKCRKSISPRYLIVEILTAGLFSLAYYRGILDLPGAGARGWAFVAVASFVAANLVALAFVDIETYTVPLVNTTSIIVIGLAVSPLFPAIQAGVPTGWTGVDRLDSTLNSLQGAILGGGMIWAMGAAAELVLRKEAMGGGDVKILAGVGAVLGWKAGLATFFIAPFLGVFVMLPIMGFARLFPRKEGGKEGDKKGDAEPGITYRYDPDEEPPPPFEEVVKSKRLLVLGFLLAAEQVASLFIFAGTRNSPAASAPLYFGATIGFFMCFYDILRRRLVAEGRWIEREIETAEDGSAEERLTGHYVPYGPFLAAAALVVLYYGDELIAFATRQLFPFG